MIKKNHMTLKWKCQKSYKNNFRKSLERFLVFILLNSYLKSVGIIQLPLTKKKKKIENVHSE